MPTVIGTTRQDSGGGWWDAINDWPVIGDVKEAVVDPVLEAVAPILEPFAPAFDWVDKTWGSTLWGAWTTDDGFGFDPMGLLGNPASSGFNLNQMNREKKQYENWDSPKYVKGTTELLNPGYLMPFAAPFKGASVVTRGAPKLSTGFGKVGRGVEWAEALPSRGLGKALKKSWDVLPKTERTLFRKLPDITDDFIRKGKYTPEEEALIREQFPKIARERLDGVPISGADDIARLEVELADLNRRISSMPEMVPETIGRRVKPTPNPARKPLVERAKGLTDEINRLKDTNYRISEIIAKEIDNIDPTLKLTGLGKVKELGKLSFLRRPAFNKEWKATRNKLAKKADEEYKNLRETVNPKTGVKYTHEEATVIADSIREVNLIDITEGYKLTPEQQAALKLTDQEAADIINHIRTYDYVNKSGAVTVSRRDMAKQAEEAFNRLVFEQKPIPNYQAKLLRQSLGPEVMGTLSSYAKKGKIGWFLDILNMPRAILASWDMSAPLRQGMILHSRALTSGRFKDLGDLWKNMFKAFGQEKWAMQADDILRESPLYKDWIANGGYHSPLQHATLSTAEEQFMSSFASKYIPMVRRSERAYQTFLNQLRYKQYEATVNMWERDLLKPGSKLTREMVDESKPALNRLINAASGRGQLPQVLEGNLGATLNATLFSPRLLISRIQFPLFSIPYGTASKAGLTSGMTRETWNLVRKEAQKELFAFLGVGTGLLSMAAIAGASIEMDPRSPDFGKIRVGNTRYDTWAGYAQFSRLFASMLTGEKKTALGEIKSQTRWDTFTRFLQSKTSPGTGLLIDVLKGQDYMGEEISVENAPSQLKKRLVPLFIQGLMEASEEYGTGKGTLMTMPEFFGAGTQTYENLDAEARKTLSKQFGLGKDIWSDDILSQARETAEPYYDIEENAWAQYPHLEAIKDQIRYLERVNPNMALRIQMQYPQIIQIRNQIAMQKKMLLLRNPDIKEALSILNR